MVAAVDWGRAFHIFEVPVAALSKRSRSGAYDG